MSKQVEKLLKDVENLKVTLEMKKTKKFRLTILERIIKRLDEFNELCEKSKEYIESIEDFIKKMKNELSIFETTYLKSYNKKIDEIYNHMRKEHKLVIEGYYMVTYMAIGLAFGPALGMIIDNIGIGISWGLVMGLIVGSIIDSFAKKKGRLL